MIKIDRLVDRFFRAKRKKEKRGKKKISCYSSQLFFFQLCTCLLKSISFYNIFSVLFACIVSMQLVISGRWWWVTLEERNYSIYACVEMVFPLTISDFLDRVVTLFIACEQRNRKATPKPQGRTILEIKIDR